MELLETVSWELKYETGILVIDRQHQQLFNLYNSFAELHNTGEQADESTIIQTLLNYIQQHFSYEEKIMKTFEYEDIVAHIDEHQRFRRKIEELKTVHENGGLHKLYAELALFLRSWLLNHIMEFDQDYCTVIPKG